MSNILSRVAAMKEAVAKAISEAEERTKDK